MWVVCYCLRVNKLCSPNLVPIVTILLPSSPLATAKVSSGVKHISPSDFKLVPLPILLNQFIASYILSRKKENRNDYEPDTISSPFGNVCPPEKGYPYNTKRTQVAFPVLKIMETSCSSSFEDFGRQLVLVTQDVGNSSTTFDQ